MKNIKKVIELSYKITMNENFQMIKSGRESNYDWDDKVVEYHQNGKIKAERHLNSNNSTSLIIQYYYDNQFKLIKETSEFKDSGNEYLTLFKYDNNILVLETRTEKSTRGWIEEDLQESLYEPKILWRKRYIYDENGRLIKTELLPDHIITSFEYDSLNRVKSQKFSTGWSNGLEVYDELGRVILIKSYSTNEGLIEKKFGYDNNENISSYILNEYRKTGTDDDGNEIYSEIPNHSTITTYKYKLDEYGNWIERVQITNNEFKYKVERSIEYF